MQMSATYTQDQHMEEVTPDIIGSLTFCLTWTMMDKCRYRDGRAWFHPSISPTPEYQGLRNLYETDLL